MTTLSVPILEQDFAERTDLRTWLLWAYPPPNMITHLFTLRFPSKKRQFVSRNMERAEQFHSIIFLVLTTTYFSLNKSWRGIHRLLLCSLCRRCGVLYRRNVFRGGKLVPPSFHLLFVLSTASCLAGRLRRPPWNSQHLTASKYDLLFGSQ